jgi:hypothetical protein
MAKCSRPTMPNRGKAVAPRGMRPRTSAAVERVRIHTHTPDGSVDEVRGMAYLVPSSLLSRMGEVGEVCVPKDVAKGSPTC